MLSIHCALLCEARPLIDYWKLQAVTHKPFKIYRRDDIAVVISGIGKTATAAAVAYLFARNDDAQDQVWLNLGVAGSASESVGTLCRANKIIDATTDQVWFPPAVATGGIHGTCLSTYDKPQTRYDSQGMYDMEAAAFYSTAARFSSYEWIQCLKVVSDTNENEINALNEARVSQLVGAKLSNIVEYTEILRAQNREWASLNEDPPFYLECLRRWRFTSTQQQQLRRLLQRYSVCDASVPVMTFLEDLTTAKSVLVALESGLSRLQRVAMSWQ